MTFATSCHCDILQYWILNWVFNFCFNLHKKRTIAWSYFLCKTFVINVLLTRFKLRVLALDIDKSIPLWLLCEYSYSHATSMKSEDTVWLLFSKFLPILLLLSKFLPVRKMLLQISSPFSDVQNCG